MVAFDTAAPLNGQKDVADILQVFIWIVFDCSESRYFRRRRFSEELFSDLPSRLGEAGNLMQFQRAKNLKVFGCLNLQWPAVASCDYMSGSVRF